MSTAQNHTLFARLEAKGFIPQHVAEVGVHAPESSNVYRYIQRDVRTTLVEPEPEALEQIKAHFSGRENITLHEAAACDEPGEIVLFKKGPSTFVGSLPDSPALTNDGYQKDEQDKFTVKAITFDSVDDGSIEVLSIDTEGSEWFVIKHLVSRPAAISVETHGGAYVNPYLSDIEAWMDREGYRVWYKGKTDTVYVKSDAIAVTAGEQVALAMMDVRIRLRRARKRAKR